MSLYTFYPTKPNGLADTCAERALVHEADVAAHAIAMLETQPSAASVVVWRGARCVLIQTRAPAAEAPCVNGH